MSIESETAQIHSMGQRGFKYLSSAGTATYSDSNTNCIYCLEESEVTIVSIVGDSLTGVTLPAGFQLVGRYSSVTMDSGSAIVYLSK